MVGDIISRENPHLIAKGRYRKKKLGHTLVIQN